MAARVMRRGTLLLAGALLVGACSGTTAETSTTLEPATSTTSTTTSSTTTTLPTTTSTTTTTTTTTTLPLNTDPIEGVPDELVALIGAPMPEFDATIAANEDGTANVEDIKRWLQEWDAWQVWVNANRPHATPEILAVGYVPGSVFDGIYTLGQENPDTLLLADLYSFEYIGDTSGLGDGFQVGRSLVITATPAIIHSYEVQAGVVASEEGPHTDLPGFALRLLGEAGDSGQTLWRARALELLNP